MSFFILLRYCIIFNISFFISEILSTLSTFEVICDDLCLSIGINNQEYPFSHFGVTSVARTKLSLSIELNKGDIITITNKNDYGSFGIVMWAN